ncbi:deoxyhypusine synthase [Archaeoglobus veneficus]|uniref:Probable deoxyhypusine synthase n=1 Tax=Archaeoglobus veneficus (strain DSM 11195 / SNP6) TaxID=693661 RepID=F2KNE7_ARCVS|nr:deoxyhypusine synthase [Archaeoglobus veneficus]AEA47349.1 deoxyhypusine synthase [Archaeoglobus veneficus SNP6]
MTVTDFTEPVRDIEVRRGLTVEELVEQFGRAGGFTAKKVAEAMHVLEEMVKSDATVFLSFPAAIVATGTRGVIKELVKRKLVDVIITTCGTLDHDLARIWRDYYHGSFMLDDAELHRMGINRIGNVLAPNESYGLILEEKLLPIIEDIYSSKKRLSTRELVWEIGKRIEGEPDAEDSIVYWSYKNRIPVFIPGITDGAVGSQLWIFYQQHKDFVIDVLADESELSDIVFESERTGALIVGGGISKHHTIWWNQFKGGLDYVVYVTTAVEWDGSLSGARPREAISWGKIKEGAKQVTVEGDATIILPLLVCGLIGRLGD